jgi:hypothetical protein
MRDFGARSCLEHPTFDGPFFTVNKMRTSNQPQQIKANVWDVSSKDLICFKPSAELEWAEPSQPLQDATQGSPPKQLELEQQQLLLHPTIAKVAAQPTFAGRCFQFRNAIVGPLGAQNYRHSGALMPNNANPSDHALVVGAFPLRLGKKR